MKNSTLEANKVKRDVNPDRVKLISSMRTACKKIAPVWPLENFVAVNPYLGFADQKFENVAQELAIAGDIQMTLPTSFYLKKMMEGKLEAADIQKVLQKKDNNASVEDFLNSLKKSEEKGAYLNKVDTVADLATQVTGEDWKRFVVARISNWAASYFDHGQAMWVAADKSIGPFAAWKQEAEIDRTPELSGLKDFRKYVKAVSNDPIEATKTALKDLGISEDASSLYLYSLLLRVGGWSAYAARLDWDKELYGGEDGQLMEFLAVLVVWESCLLKSISHPNMGNRWSESKKEFLSYNVKNELNQQLVQKLVLQEAFDLSAQRAIVEKFKGDSKKKEETKEQLKAQAIFCIDVRSEVFRRNLELVDSKIDTLGFAGFFAFPVKYVPVGHEHGEAQCPVLLTTGPTIVEELATEEDTRKAKSGRKLSRQMQQTWKSFKSGAVSCFSFVSPLGLSYLPKLFTDSFGLTRPVPHPEKVGLSKEQNIDKKVSVSAAIHNSETIGIPLNDQIGMAKNALNAMSLSEDFAKFVLITGHGASTVNNPYATGLDCGACGGHSGEANAKVAAVVLNNPEVRVALLAEKIAIPGNTIFLACLHDTTTDEITIYNESDVAASRSEELAELKKSLAQAGHAARTERALRMSATGKSTVDKDVLGRSTDWSQTRPEWGLAGCSAFVVAPRERTKGIDFGGKSFLHSYEWKKDQSFSILELIMTAPMVVTSWISLQYYASTVDNKYYGSGNKTLHNVTGGLGVLEGYSGDLRTGLPMQSVHDGVNYQHEPLRLNVIIEAPISAMTDILAKHESVRNLCDNGWLNLLAMNEDGKVAHRYAGDLVWEAMDQ